MTAFEVNFKLECSCLECSYCDMYNEIVSCFRIKNFKYQDIVTHTRVQEIVYYGRLLSSPDGPRIDWQRIDEVLPMELQFYFLNLIDSHDFVDMFFLTLFEQTMFQINSLSRAFNYPPRLLDLLTTDVYVLPDGNEYNKEREWLKYDWEFRLNFNSFVHQHHQVDFEEEAELEEELIEMEIDDLNDFNESGFVDTSINDE